MATRSPGPILVTGFEPFLGRRRNRSWDVVERIRPVPGMERVRLPVDFAALPAAIGALLDRDPRALLLVGEAPGKEVRVEQVALNVADSRDPDNRGRVLRSEPLVPGGPLALSASWDAGRLARELSERGIPSRTSFHAGTFACNAALYLALRGLDPSPPIGFLHLPRARWPRGPRTRRLVEAVELALSTLSPRSRDAPA
jgi:pyroglutamyl-peptidase